MGEMTISWPDLEPLAAAMNAMKGRDVIEAMCRGEIPAPPFAHLIGITEARLQEDDSFTIGFEPGERHCNFLGVVNGGIIATLHDAAIGCVLQARLRRGETFVSLSLEAKFIRPVTIASGLMSIRAALTSRGRDVSTAVSEMVDARGRLYSTATSTLRTFPRQPSAAMPLP